LPGLRKRTGYDKEVTDPAFPATPILVWPTTQAGRSAEAFQKIHTQWDKGVRGSEKERMNIKRVATVVLGLLYAVFVIQNTQVLEVRFLFWSTQVSRALILAGTFMLGFISGRMWSWIRRKQEEATEAKAIPPAEEQQPEQGGEP
jgi:putative membrane protein